MQNQRSELVWRNGQVPVSERFDDPYYSLENGLAETRHVFLQGNDLPARFRDGFHVAELGFGTGLNFLATVAAWKGPGRLRYTSFEAYPLAPEDITRALGAFPGMAEIANALVGLLRAGTSGTIGAGVALDLVIGDARETLPAWDGAADAWFLDGFAPARNPELWEPELMQAVADHTQAGGTFATYTAAGAVRRALDSAGFNVTRVPGFGRKRHMSVGTLR